MKSLMQGLVAAFAAFMACVAEANPRLVPDYNRDGAIENDDAARAANGEAFTIWLNGVRFS